MNIKKVSMIYFSPTHSTQKIVRAIAKGTGYPAEEYDFTILASAPKPPDLGAEELVIVGAPVYVGLVPRAALNYLNGLKGQNTPCVLVGVYGNRHFDDYLVQLEDIMREHGFLPVAAAAFLAEHSFSDKLAGGRPDADDLEKAREFGESISGKLAAGNGVPVLAHGAVPGGRPYRKPFNSDRPQTPFAPQVNENCTECGACAAACPTGAINPDDVRDIKAELCIRCRACAKVCPVEAIDFVNPAFWEHIEVLKKNFSGYKEPTIVI